MAELGVAIEMLIYIPTFRLSPSGPICLVWHEGVAEVVASGVAATVEGLHPGGFIVEATGVVVEATPHIEMGNGIVPDVKCVL